MLMEDKKISIYRIKMCAYLMKWDCVFVIWTLDFRSETLHLIVKHWAFQMINITLGCKSEYTESNSCVGYLKLVIKIQYHDLCLDSK